MAGSFQQTSPLVQRAFYARYVNPFDKAFGTALMFSSPSNNNDDDDELSDSSCSKPSSLSTTYQSFPTTPDLGQAQDIATHQDSHQPQKPPSSPPHPSLPTPRAQTQAQTPRCIVAVPPNPLQTTFQPETQLAQERCPHTLYPHPEDRTPLRPGTPYPGRHIQTRYPGYRVRGLQRVRGFRDLRGAIEVQGWESGRELRSYHRALGAYVNGLLAEIGQRLVVDFEREGGEDEGGDYFGFGGDGVEDPGLRLCHLEAETGLVNRGSGPKGRFSKVVAAVVGFFGVEK